MSGKKLTSFEETASKRFIEQVNLLRQEKSLGPIPWNSAIKFLMARKFDVERAISLYIQHDDTRHREGLIRLNPEADPLRSELTTGKFTVLPCRDNSGAAIAVFTARLHDLETTSHQTTLQGIVYQLDTALLSTDTQRCGIVFIYDMTGSTYNNFDYALSQKILNMLKGGYPARLKKVLIVTAPLWFRGPFKVLRLFVREKLRDRVYTVSLPELVNHIPAQCLPYKLGGSLEVQHEAWLLRCLESMPKQSNEFYYNTAEAAVKQAHASLMKGDNHMHSCSNSQNNLSKSQSDLKSSSTELTDSSEIIFDESNSEISENDINNYESEDKTTSLDGESMDTVSRVRDVPMELSVAEESKIEGTKNHKQLQNIIIEVQQEALRVNNGHASDKSLNGSSHCEKHISHSSAGGFTLDEFVQYLRETGRAGLYNEYSEIKSKTLCGTFNNSRERWNLAKNRYVDVLCYDHSRVELEPQDEQGRTTYINANFVSGYQQKNAFISSQGPLPGTFGDFWRMIWEQRVCLVVMTTKTVERGRTKCGQYWPGQQGSSVTHSHFSITNNKVVDEEDFIRSELSVLDSRTGEERIIEHLQFTSWPDYGVPESAIAMLGFLAKVRELQAKYTAQLIQSKSWSGHKLGPPILVHCSAGIGRTGTFCTLDTCIQRLEDVGLIEVRGTVERIRSERAFSIQMPDQYVFCHLALLEYALSTDKLTHVDITGFENDDSESD